MKVLKSLDMALLYRAFRFARRDTLSLSLMACFAFDAPGGLDGLVPENEVWARVEQALGQDGILDEGYPKPTGEFLVYGAACAPHGTEVEQMRVSVRVGRLAKNLVVSGERRFGAVGMPSRPVPYARMPIVPATAFGGADWAANPSGKGHGPLGEGGGAQQALPNVEYETQRMLGRNDRPDPAGFWAFDAMSPQRRKYLGTCDERWLSTDWPHLPVDTRQQLFMSAPSDQWLASGYFAGDETFEIQGMDARCQLLQGRLPGLRARCFVYGPMPDSVGSVVREVEARAETVWLFPELRCGIVLYRALAAVADSDASDVTHMLAAWEKLEAAPLPFEHYRDRLLASLRKAADAAPVESAPPAAAPAAVPELPAVPAAAAPISEEAAQELAQVKAMTADLNRQTDAFMSKHGLTAKDLEPFLKVDEPLPSVSLAELERLTAAQNARTRAFMQTHGLSDQDLARFLKAVDPGPEPSLADLPAMAAKMQDATREMLAKAGMTEAEVSGWLASNPATAGLAALPRPGTPLPPVDPVALAALASLPKAPGMPPALELPTPPLPESHTAQLTREQVIARHAASESLAGYDLSGVDLSALDLSGADFSAALLEKTSFAKSTLQAVKFGQALLKETDFSGADLRHAELLDTSGGGGKFAEADLRAANLMGGDFSQADFSAARLGEARLDRALFGQAKMAGVDAPACHAHETQFDDGDLKGANFSGATLDRATFRDSVLSGGNFEGASCEQTVFHGARAQQAVFSGANLGGSRAQAACFDGAHFAGANLVRANWQGAQVRGANFAGALLDHADFSNAQAVTATFRLASAQGAKFAKADLSGADLTAVNLFKGSLRKARIDGTLLSHANLYGVNFDETQPTLAAVEGSNIERTILKFRPPVV